MPIGEAVSDLKACLTEDKEITRYSLNKVLGTPAKDRDEKLATYSLMLAAMADDLRQDDDVPKYYSKQLAILSRLMAKGKKETAQEK